MGSSLLLLAPLGSVLILIFAGYLAYAVMKQSEGAGQMKKIAGSMALFVHFCGTNFTKAAVDTGLVGEVEADILKNDLGNSAIIADNAEDKAGDAAVMGADLYESPAGFIISTSVLAVAAGLSSNGATIPLAMAAIGLLISVIGILFLHPGEEAEPKVMLGALPGVVWSSGILIAVISFFLFNAVLGSEHTSQYFAVLKGLAAGIPIGFLGKSISNTYQPTQRLAGMPLTGSATGTAGGISPGRLSTAIPRIIIGTVVLAGYYLAGGAGNFKMGLYGVGISAVGMLSVLGIILATDVREPVADNAESGAGVACLESEAGKHVGALDSLGNRTTAGNYDGKLGWCTG